MRGHRASRAFTFLFQPGRSIRAGRFVAAALCVVTTGSVLSGCTAAQRAGESSSYLIVNSLLGASGAKPGAFGETLGSDVVTLVKATGEDTRIPTVYEDTGQLNAVLALRDPGSAANPATPSPTNYVTLNRYHVQYLRADGRNTPGVDVPYPFDGALTATVTPGGIAATFTLVRIQAKEEAPLKALANGGGASTISTMAEVTFYGADQAGHTVTTTSQISVTFSDWGDPQ